MAYSDYGSYNWAKENGEWVYKLEWEDRSLIMGSAPREIEAATGLKLDAVAMSCDAENDEALADIPYVVKCVSHSVIGNLDGFAVVSYKGSPEIIHNGEPLTFNLEDNDYDIYLEDSGNEVRVKLDTECYWSIAWVRNGDQEFLGVCGYGLGEHWWLDEDGDEMDWQNKDESLRHLKIQPINHWPREAECLKYALQKLGMDEQNT